MLLLVVNYVVKTLVFLVLPLYHRVAGATLNLVSKIHFMQMLIQCTLEPPIFMRSLWYCQMNHVFMGIY